MNWTYPKAFVALALALFLLPGCTVSYTPNSNKDQPPTAAGTPEQQAEALAAAKHFAQMIDDGQYEKTWEEAAPELQTRTKKLAWVNILRMSRKLLGGTPKREKAGFGFASEIDPDYPQGEYVVVLLKGVSGKATTEERVVMKKDDDIWKIIGYHVNKRISFGNNAN